MLCLHVSWNWGFFGFLILGVFLYRIGATGWGGSVVLSRSSCDLWGPELRCNPPNGTAIKYEGDTLDGLQAWTEAQGSCEPYAFARGSLIFFYCLFGILVVAGGCLACLQHVCEGGLFPW